MQKNQKLKDAYDLLVKHNRPICIFLYCPPKVGSTTLVTSLRVSFGKLANVIHIHDEVMLNVLTGIKDITVNDIIKYASQVTSKVYVIDIYRTPIERKMSEYFDKLSFHFNNTEENIINFNTEILIDRFNKLFPYLACSEHYLEKYPISRPECFNVNDKYIIQQNDNIHYLKLRLMDVDEWSTILSKLFNVQVVIINDYFTSNKPLGNKYKAFKEKYKLPLNYYELLENDKNLLFYLNSTERTNYLQSWADKIHNETVFPFSNNEYVLYLDITLKNQFYDKIETNHYIDNGCICKACDMKRKEIYCKALNGECITDRIIHNQCVLNLKKRILENVKNNIKHINNNRKKNSIRRINTQLF
jgi:hypothetical protein